MPVRDASGRFVSSADLAAIVKSANGDLRKAQSFPLLAEMGVQSPKRLGRTVYDDFLPSLQGPKAVKVYREMAENDATIGAVLFAVDMLIRQVPWTVEPEDAPPEVAEWLEAQMHAMSHTWPDFISSVLSMLTFGWSAFEIVYQQDGGRIAWRKLALRGQETLVRFEHDEAGGIQGFTQSTPGGKVTIPIEKLLLFRTTPMQPTGRSILRNAYRSWFFKKRVEEIMMIGIERDLAGLPMARVPAEILIERGAVYDEIKRIVTRTKRDEQEGIIWPNERDDQGNPLYEFDLLQTGGRPKVDPIQAIRMFAGDMAGTVLADFIALGRDSVGSRALAEPKQELFRTALGAWADMMQDIINRHGVARLMDINGWPYRPRIIHGEIQDIDLGALGEFILGTAQAGMDWGFANPEDNLADAVRGLAGFDPAPTDEMEKHSGGFRWDRVRREWRPAR